MKDAPPVTRTVRAFQKALARESRFYPLKSKCKILCLRDTRHPKTEHDILYRCEPIPMLAGHKLPLVARRPEEGSSLDVAPAVGAGAEARRRGTHRGRMFLPSITYALESSFYRHPGPSESEIFDELVLRHGSSDSLALDLGCGRGAEGHDYRGMLGRVLGCDRDPRALSNPYLDEVVIADLEDLPFAEASFDLVFSRAVFEHLERPATVFGEIRRVLKPGGRLVVMTPNRNHYVTLISRLT